MKICDVIKLICVFCFLECSEEVKETKVNKEKLNFDPSLAIDTNSLSNVMSTQGNPSFENQSAKDMIFELQSSLDLLKERLSNSPPDLKSQILQAIQQSDEWILLQKLLKDFHLNPDIQVLKEISETFLQIAEDPASPLEASPRNLPLTPSFGLRSSSEASACFTKPIREPKLFSDPEVVHWNERVRLQIENGQGYDDWAFEYMNIILYALHTGILAGRIENGKRYLKPGFSMTRGELASVYVNIFHGMCRPKVELRNEIVTKWNTASRKVPIRDAKASAWYRPHLARAVNLGIFAFNEQGNYRGDEPLNEKEMGWGGAGLARVLAKYCQSSGNVNRLLADGREGLYHQCSSRWDNHPRTRTIFSDNAQGEHSGKRFQMASFAARFYHCLRSVFCVDSPN
jgi:hypothetical protein